MTVPRSTLRLQLHRGFTFDDALAHVDYFAALGVSHLYLSPITVSVPGSMHGYDTIDYTRVNPELGGEPGLLRLADAVHARQMGLIADIVPNHMGIAGGHNAWWLDILEWGRHATHARYFDIDWHSPDPALRGKVLAPCLGAPYGEELAAGRIVLSFDAGQGRFFVTYGEHRFPICPVDYPLILRGAAHAHHPELTALAEHFEGLTVQPEQRSLAQAAREALRAFASAHGSQPFDAALAAYAPNAAASRERLHRLLERQFFRLAWWRTAADEVNWRRFFDIGTLAAMRTERMEVFDAMHALVLRLFAQGVIDGVRIDHVDGLVDPREYCQRLREKLVERESERPPQLDGSRPYVVVEKILARGEALPSDWGVDGTTGYDFMNDVGALLHDPRGEPTLTATWNELSGSNEPYAELVCQARRKILAENLSAELDRAARGMHRIAREQPASRDFTYTSIRRVLAELAAHFPVYRMYPLGGARTSADEAYFRQALDGARRSLARGDHPVLAYVAASLNGPSSDNRVGDANGAATAAANGLAHRERRTAATLFAQVTAPLAAKALEDTVFYRYGRLLSRNEVGADPGEFALDVDAFHAANLERAQRFAHALITTATHDHKRGEDVRARLAVLSEMAEEWTATLRAWSTLNAPHRRAFDAKQDLTGTGGDAENAEADAGRVAETPDDTGQAASAGLSLACTPLPGTLPDWAPGPAAEAMLYQTLVGAWPYGLDHADEQGVQAFAERIAVWQLKASREAKLQTSWHANDEAYEAASRAFLFDILAPQRRDGFLRELSSFVGRIARAGAINSLTQTLLRMTCPGVPDLYQGTELWDFSLVDPDNRRPVDFGERHRLLVDTPPSDQLPNWRDGRVKLGIVHRALTLRAVSPALFLEGSYIPLTVTGPRARHAIAFARQHGDAYAIVIATRLASSLVSASRDVPHVDPEQWEDTSIALPAALAGRALFDCLSPAAPKADAAGKLYLRDALSVLPVALLVEEGVPRD
ncbi:malto-oligosyltrehalose synthase [Trinickia diaoshuihuensis]|uniref:malto-oligosyltrehalose synthase n=1 Tax=Trinickia diaoshuihuensis TaxID=2292265 RepID=UPI000E26441F|nr:malto-oligosyltrehalose synthase [Trinickia diaoshuihuensis]